MNWKQVGIGISFCPFLWGLGRVDATYITHGYMLAVGPFRLSVKF